MRLYLDSSALVKLVKVEAESSALRRYLRRSRADARVTCALAKVEVVRAVVGGGPAAVAHARRLLARLDQINLDRQLLDDAASLAPGVLLRSLDAIHLAAARAVGPALREVVTYDERMRAAADAVGLCAVAPT